jgi:DNA-directed RNA polymerase specialized sigma24 family protein
MQGMPSMDAENIHNDAGKDPADKSEGSALTAEIAHLPAAVRWIVILGERDGLSPKDIANLAGVSLELVKSMLGRGLAIIQQDIPIEPGESS